MRNRPSSLLFVGLLAACGHPGAGAEGGTMPRGAGRQDAIEASGDGATGVSGPSSAASTSAPAVYFGELLAQAATRVDAAEVGPGAGSAAGSAQPAGAAHCLLGPAPGGALAMRAPVTPATRQWPEADPAPSLSGDVPPRVLTRHGELGPPGAAPTVTSADAAGGPLVVVLTPLPPSAVRRVGWVLAVAADGQVTEAFTDGRRATAGHPDVISASRAIGARAAMEGLTVIVTASADTQLQHLYALLQGVPRGVPVALAVVLPAGSRLPPASSQDAPEGGVSLPAACPDGLSEPADDAAEGALSPQAIVAALGPLQAAALDCLAHASGSAAFGGRLTLALRIGSAGQVAEACALRDAIGDPVMAACVAEAARALRFPTPNPAGDVDVHVPLLLVPTEQPPLPATCE